MGLDHKTVAQAKEFYEMNTAMLDETQQKNPDLVAFTRAVERTMRVKTVPRDRNTSWVYRDGDLMAIGYIGYGDFATSVHGENKFVVCARGINKSEIRRVRGSTQHAYGVEDGYRHETCQEIPCTLQPTGMRCRVCSESQDRS